MFCASDKKDAYLLRRKIILKEKNTMVDTIPSADSDVVTVYKANGIEISSYVTYVESRGIFPSANERFKNIYEFRGF